MGKWGLGDLIRCNFLIENEFSEFIIAYKPDLKFSIKD